MDSMVHTGGSTMLAGDPKPGHVTQTVSTALHCTTASHNTFWAPFMAPFYVAIIRYAYGQGESIWTVVRSHFIHIKGTTVGRDLDGMTTSDRLPSLAMGGGDGQPRATVARYHILHYITFTKYAIYDTTSKYEKKKMKKKENK